MSNTEHVAVVPFPFTSHPSTLMTLLLKMANSAPQTRFSFFNTEKSNKSLFSPSVLDHLPPNVTIYSIEDGVPSNHKFTGKNHHEPFNFFLNSAPKNLTKHFKLAIAESGCNITCIIGDAFLPFMGDIAENFQASWVAFYTGLPCCFASHLYTNTIYKKLGNGSIDENQNVDFVPGLSAMRVKDLPPCVLVDDSRKSVFAKMLSQIGDSLSKATAVALSSFEEINPEALNNDLKSKFENLLNLGIVSTSSDSDPANCLPWLDRHGPKSVAYISFGTVGALQEKEMQALAEALEQSDVSFLWSLKDNLLEKLPEGFVERTKTRGKIVPWAPQRSVLSHGAVAVFISHAGFNAVRESVVCGVPMICRPFLGDQMMAARMIEIELRIGVAVDDGVITTVGLMNKLRMFLPGDDEREKILRDNVEGLKNIVSMATRPGGSAARDFDKLMEIISTA